MTCRICEKNTSEVFKTRVLKKYDVTYHQCNSCEFIQTDEPFWLPEAYETAITSLDIGLISRNLYLQEQVPLIIDNCFASAKVMLDYAGGYGLFVRLMRDKGYNFFRQDIYCENIFANYFDINNTDNKSFDLLTAFEVFEHLNQPIEEITKMFRYSEHIVFSTQLIPDKLEDFKNWWYVSPLTGQHIAFYSIKTLSVIAKKFDKTLYSNGTNLHIFTGKKLERKQVETIFPPNNRKSIWERFALKWSAGNKPVSKRATLLQSDYKFIEDKLIGKS
jgi:hypothetical protein